jgi:hypothetical protein
VATPRLQPTEASCLEVSLFVAQTVLLRAQGHVTRLTMTKSLAEFQGLLARVSGPSLIIDISNLGNFEPGAVDVGADYFRLFKGAGGKKVVLVSGLATARLAAFAIAFAARVPLVAAQSLSEACDILNIQAPRYGITAQRR